MVFFFFFISIIVFVLFALYIIFFFFFISIARPERLYCYYYYDEDVHTIITITVRLRDYNRTRRVHNVIIIITITIVSDLLCALFPSTMSENRRLRNHLVMYLIHAEGESAPEQSIQIPSSMLLRAPPWLSHSEIDARRDKYANYAR